MLRYDGNGKRALSDAETILAVLVAVTAYGQANDDAGFSHHFVKPVDGAKLTSLLAELGAARAATAEKG